VGDGAGPGPVLASPHGATSMPSYCKSCIEYLARLRSVIPPRGSHSTGYRRDAASRVGPNCFRKQYTFRCARNEDSKAQRPKRSTRSSAESDCGSRQICGSSTDGVLCRYRPQSLFKIAHFAAEGTGVWRDCWPTSILRWPPFAALARGFHRCPSIDCPGRSTKAPMRRNHQSSGNETSLGALGPRGSP
jgi:hypothetical protein